MESSQPVLLSLLMLKEEVAGTMDKAIASGLASSWKLVSFLSTDVW